MNSKKAKLLRRYVRMSAIDKEGTPLEDSGYVEDEKARKFVDVEKISGDGKSTYTDRQQISAGTISLAPRTVKGLYRKMKKTFTVTMRNVS